MHIKTGHPVKNGLSGDDDAHTGADEKFKIFCLYLSLSHPSFPVKEFTFYSYFST